MTAEQLTLHSVVPVNLKDRDLSDSEIWYTELALEQGKHFHISAPSGSGKTTLAHLLYGLRSAFAGAYHLGDQFAKDLRIKDWARLRKETISIVFQDLRLFDDISAWDNIQVKNELTNFKSEQEIKELAAQLEVESLLQNTTKTLSQGEKQRIAIVRALCQPFEWIILDEPFSHLDADTRQKAIELIKSEVAGQNASIIGLQLAPDDYFDYHQKLRL